MKTIVISILVSGSILASGLWHQAFAEKSREEVDVRQLFESKCNLCHSIDRPKSKTKTKEGWETTVMRMKNTNGCPITDEEAGLIIDYLAETYGK